MSEHDHHLGTAAGHAQPNPPESADSPDSGQSHDHERGNGHGHRDGPGSEWWHRVRHLIRPHSHDSADKIDSALESSREGLRALWISLVVLGITALFQVVIVLISGSVALLGDTLHNFADALTAIPLGIAFLIGRRLATRAYTYGFGRAEDLAGIVIVLVIFGSAVLAGWTAVDRLVNPQEITHIPWVFAAGVIGFAGNEIVARYRITVGRRIGSAALVADGLHARTDGFTSLAVVLAACGAWLGWTWADPAVGLAITAAIAFVLKDAAREVYYRLMDRVDPQLVDEAERELLTVDGVIAVSGLRVRWIGHRLHAETTIVVDAGLSLVAAHEIAADAEHQLTHRIARLTGVTVHVDPASQPGEDRHAALSHERRARRGRRASSTTPAMNSR